MSTVLGVGENLFAKARDLHSGPYSEGLLGALRGSRAVIDSELFGSRLRNLSFFNEVSRPAGIAQLMYGLISFQGMPPSFVALGRSSGEGFSEEHRVAFERLIQPLTLADAALAGLDATEPTAQPFQLTRGQQELVSFVRMGLTNTLIASALGISPNTVRNRLAELFRQCGVSSRAELVHVTRNWR
jgi:DNA-binding CsgD family transcriptional regulator